MFNESGSLALDVDFTQRLASVAKNRADEDTMAANVELYAQRWNEGCDLYTGESLIGADLDNWMRLQSDRQAYDACHEDDDERWHPSDEEVQETEVYSDEDYMKYYDR